ncbi:glycosyltransferase family 9 protein [Roseateles sp. DB2]|uniref:glycosyltransferase family 9 protein n=1 Tax=Roseateles sp. DB2 TaxID=3453717 RepID=UPI003EEFF0A0
MSAADAHLAWAQARRVLLLRLDGLGDVLMSTPAMAAVRESLPLASLTLLTSPAGAALAPHLPWLDRVLAYDAPWVKSGADAQAARGTVQDEADQAMLQVLRRERFDAAIIFSACTQSALPAALLCRLAGIPLCLAHAREQVYGLLSDRRPESDVLGPAMRHEVQRQLDLVASVGLHTSQVRLRFEVLAADAVRMAGRLADAGLPTGRPYVLLHPGASAPSRRYPPRAFAAAAARLRADEAGGGPAVVACAGPGEGGLLQQLGAAMPRPPVLLDGPPSLGELGALIAGARVLVANNSGPMHLAAALGTPVVTLYALTNPQHTPGQVSARVLNREVPCRDCLQSTCPEGHQRCLAGVLPEEVVQAARELLVEAAP